MMTGTRKRRLIQDEESDEENVKDESGSSNQHAVSAERTSKRSRRVSKAPATAEDEYQGQGDEEGVDASDRVSEEDEQLDEYELPQEITEEDRQRWAEENEMEIAHAQNRRGRVGASAERGVIETIEMFDFMCHRHLKVPFGPKINFIIGHNGSGKSAILTAIMVCLGGKATATNRAQNLKALIREGASMAEVRLQLKNRGEDAFKSDEYGPSIIIERRIARDGSSSYKLKSAKGKTISTKRDELTAMCDHMNIQVDNPINVLGQDAARQFLHTSSEHDKYNFFSRGTQLAQLSADYVMVKECIDTMQATIKDKKELLPELYELSKQAEVRWKDMQQAASLKVKLGNLEKEWTWSQIEEIEKEVAGIEADVEKHQEKVPKIEERRAQALAEVAEIEKRIVEADANLRGQRDDLQPTHDKKRALEQQLRDKRSELKACQDEEANVNQEMKNIRNHLRKLEDQIAKEKQRLESNTASKRVELEAKIKDAVDKSDRMRLDLATAKEDLANVEKELEELAPKKTRIKEVSDRDRRELEDIRRQIQEMKGQKENAMRAFGRTVPEVLRDVEEAKRRGRFQGEVMGPVGRYVKLSDEMQQWAPVIESALGATLNAFVIEKYADRTILEDIFRRHRCVSEIITTERRIFDYHSKEPQDYLTICRALTFDDEWMRRILIDRHNIEQTILITSRAEADRVTSSGPDGGMPENVAFCFTINLIRVGDKSGAASSIQMRPYRGPPRLSKNIDREIEIKEGEARTKEDSVRFRINELQRLITDMDQLDGTRLNHKKKMVFLEKDLKTTMRAIELLQQSLQDCDDTSNLSVFEEERAKTLEEIETLKRQYEPVALQKQKINEEMEPIKREILAQNDLLLKHDETMRQLRGVVEGLTMEKQDQEGRVAHWIGRLEKELDEIKSFESALAERRAYLAECEQQARKVCERVPVQSTKAKLEREIKSIRSRLDREAAERGSTVEEITQDWIRKKKDFQDAKVAIHQLERFVEHLKVTLERRMGRWREFRANIVTRSIKNFQMLLAARGYTGDLDFQHADKKLVIRVETEDQRTAKAGVARDKDPKSLSGGEKSFSTICLLMSMWESMHASIRCLDEFDVFMDAVNRRISMKLLIDSARESDGVQFILITPQDASSVSPGPDIRVHRLHDPERNQAVLQ